jgi:ABC-type multidrug transport system fused ATPase/permease subunit
MLLLIPIILIGVCLEALSIGMVIPALGLIIDENYLQANAYACQILEKIGNPKHEQLIIFGLFALAGAFCVKNIYLFLQIQMQGTFVYGAQREITLNLFQKYLSNSYLFHLNTSSAKLLRNLTTEVNSYCNFFLMPVINLATEILVVLAILFFILLIEPHGTILLLVMLTLLIFVFVKLTKPMVSSWGVNRLIAEEGKMKHLQEGFKGIKEILLSQRKDFFLSRFQAHNKLSGLMNKKEYIFQYVPKLGVEVIAVCSLVAMCVFMVKQGSAHSQVAHMLGLMATAGFRLIPSFSRILNNLQAVNYGWASVTALQSEQENGKRDLEFPDLSISETKVTSFAFNHTLTFSNVSFTYDNSTTPIFKQLDFSIKAGECVGIRGESGVGKSSLINLVLGLIHPTEGKILVDDQRIDRLNLPSWQRIIGYVPQEVYLIEDTLKRNIAFGLSDSEIDDDRVHTVIKIAQLDSLIASKSEGFDLVVGEDGARLSGGQKQRIGIARALYHDPRVLVLDEATSGLDAETERQLLESLSPLKGNKTILIVAHRETALNFCSSVYTIENGQLLASSS